MPQHDLPTHMSGMLPDGTLAGKTALVTGGGTGLGKAMALEFARLGANVVVAGRKHDVLLAAEKEIAAHGGGTHALQLDVRRSDDVAAAIDTIVELFGALDILVNNAAGNFIVPSLDLTANGWRSVVEIVLNGTWFCSQSAAKAMVASGRGGSILNIGTTYAWTGNPGTVHSACAKAGVLAMTQTLAVEWAAHKIRVNLIAPGPIAETGAVAQLWPSEDGAKRIVDMVPLGRIGERQEIANAASFVVSDYAAFMTGACLVIDGGRWLGKGAFAK